MVRELIQRQPVPAVEIAATPLDDDLALLDQEVKRCRAILAKLSSLDGEQSPLEVMSLSHLIADVTEPLRHFGIPVLVESVGEAPEPQCRRNPGMLYGLGNLVENAIDFASTTVRIDLAWTLDRVGVTIRDDGPGFLPDILAKVGDPYVTTRGESRRNKSDDGAGLGLGLFIAKTLLGRSGATLSMRNAQGSETGAILLVEWPRVVFEQGREARNVESTSYVLY